MAPEVLGGAEPSKESDYFSLGLVAYTMLTGRHPFFHNHPSCLWTEEDNIGDKWFIPRDIESGDVPVEVAEAIMALLSRNPSDRSQAFETLSIAVSEYSIAKMPVTPSEEKYWMAPATQVTLTLTEKEMLDRTYKQARYDYLVASDRQHAASILEDFLKEIRWERFKNSNNAALADCWSFKAFMSTSDSRFYKDAVESATHGLEIHPDHVPSLHARGYAYAQLGDDEKAKTDLKKALERERAPTKRKQIDRLLKAVEKREIARSKGQWIQFSVGQQVDGKVTLVHAKRRYILLLLPNGWRAILHRSAMSHSLSRKLDQDEIKIGSFLKVEVISERIFSGQYQVRTRDVEQVKMNGSTDSNTDALPQP